RLCVTVYQDDDEAFEIWHKTVGLSRDRVHRLGADKNYWPANAISEGPNGPCGPCTEIFYRVAAVEEMTGDFKKDEEAGRWLEVWNNVFTQFNRNEDAQGKPILHPLPNKNNDTGAGFERIVALLQNKSSVFDTDLFQPIIQRIEQLSHRKYGGTMSAADVAFRVIAEHARAAVFCIGDLITPSNEGRGYTMRYIIRRAVLSGRLLGFDELFLHKIAPEVIEKMGPVYHELSERSDLIIQTMRAEEGRFHQTLATGFERLVGILSSEEVKKSGKITGKQAFMLYDTYGYPLELVKEFANVPMPPIKIVVDENGFYEEMERHRQRSREAAEPVDVFTSTQTINQSLALTTPTPTQFLGYKQMNSDARVIAILNDNRAVESARAGDKVELILDQTPFYAEAGGQVGDQGWIFGPTEDVQCSAKVRITDTRKFHESFRHIGVVEEGEIAVGQEITAAVDADRRRRIMRNHTATHLLQAALRQVLGEHVHQKGSLVAPDRLRFDFTHPQALTPVEIERIEALVNEKILEDRELLIHNDLPIAEARKLGAMALFGEKYGDLVRMVEIPGFSRELCGGTHLKRTAEVGLFKIISESSVAAGVRRIDALTGDGSYQYLRNRETMMAEAAALLKVGPDDLVSAVDRLLSQRQQMERQLHRIKSQNVKPNAAELREAEVAGMTLVIGSLDGADGEALANLADEMVKKTGSAVVLLGSTSDGKALFVAKVTPDLVKRGLHAGNLVREIAKIAGGGGGGRPDFAQAGGRHAGKVAEALEAAKTIVARQVEDFKSK
ncbi:MAG: alanine--tRNA ligase, partial [Armatimonadetes bacterium]|nr:alanine--tRNA ligase [Armatimonadota bacterium]